MFPKPFYWEPKQKKDTYKIACVTHWHVASNMPLKWFELLSENVFSCESLSDSSKFVDLSFALTSNYDWKIIVEISIRKSTFLYENDSLRRDISYGFSVEREPVFGESASTWTYPAWTLVPLGATYSSDAIGRHCRGDATTGTRLLIMTPILLILYTSGRSMRSTITCALVQYTYMQECIS